MHISIVEFNSGVVTKYKFWLSLMVLFALLFNVNGEVVAAPPAKSIDFWNDNEPTSRLKVNHSAYQAILTKYVDDQHPSGINRFDYGAVSGADQASLGDYIDYLLLLEPRQLNPKEQKAYWINLHNARVLQLVIEEFQDEAIESVNDMRFYRSRRGPWARKTIEFLQQKISLQNIVDGILRPQYGDHRIHFALLRPSLSGPNILKTAYTGSNIEALLTKAEKDYLSHSRAVRYSAGRIELSGLFEDYDTDFAGTKSELLSYLAPLVSEELAAIINSNPPVSYNYDWALNSPGN